MSFADLEKADRALALEVLCWAISPDGGARVDLEQSLAVRRVVRRWGPAGAVGLEARAGVAEEAWRMACELLVRGAELAGDDERDEPGEGFAGLGIELEAVVLAAGRILGGELAERAGWAGQSCGGHRCRG